jgi:hypothetical protein
VNPQDLSAETTRALTLFLGLGGLAVLIAFLNFTSNSLRDWFAKADDKGTRALISWTAVLAFATVVSAVVAGFTLTAIQGQLDEMRKAAVDAKTTADAAKKSSEATERLSTSNRAWLLVRFISRDDATISPGGFFATDARFQIRNYGQTPAIITSAIPHLFFQIGILGKEPDPVAQEAAKLHEIRDVILIDRKTGDQLPANNFFSHDAQVIIGPNECLCEVIGNFIFRRADVFALGGSDSDRQTLIRGGTFYFYVLLKYRDIYETDRETSYYARLFGPNLAQAPSPENDKKYNHWK